MGTTRTPPAGSRRCTGPRSPSRRSQYAAGGWSSGFRLASPSCHTATQCRISSKCLQPKWWFHALEWRSEKAFSGTSHVDPDLGRMLLDNGQMGAVTDVSMGGRQFTNADPRQRPVAAYHSRPIGDVVLASPPPYRMLPWLGMGIPFVSALLEQHGLSSRIVRFLDDPEAAPAEFGDFGDEVMWGNPPLADRMARMRALAAARADFFELLLTRLLAGPEGVFGFSAWRLNADVIIELTRQLKERRPEALIVIGGPEATVSPGDFDHPWVDVVVMNGGEGAIGPVFQALVENRPADAAGWDKVWVNPAHVGLTPPVAKRAPVPTMPRVDYAPIVPLFLADPKPVIPVLLNVGCPFHCSFCTNSTIYPGLEWGTPQRLLDEMLQISAVWSDAYGEGEV